MPKKKIGRPRHKINQGEFEKLCMIQCTQEECAAWFACDLVTLQRWVKMTYGKPFSQVFAQKKGNGKISLRRSLYARAISEDGPPAIAIFVAKNHLGMADKIESINTNTNIDESKLVVEFTQEGGDGNADET